MARKVKKELHSPEVFEQSLREEFSVAADFELPLSVIALRAGEEGFEPVRSALQTLRVADLICQPHPAELLVVLPNTGAAGARVVEARLRSAVPEAAFGLVYRIEDDGPQSLLDRAAAAHSSEPSSETS